MNIIWPAVVFLLLLFFSVSFASETAGAPLRPVQVFARAAIVRTAPDLAGARPVTDPAWDSAESIGPFFSGERVEEDGRFTEVRLVSSGDVLYIRASCGLPAGAAPAADEGADRFVFFFANTPEPVFPFTEITFRASGSCGVARVFRAYGRWKEHRPATELDPSAITVRTGRTDGGWWLVAAVPMKQYGIPAPAFYAQFGRAGGSGGGFFAWAGNDGRAPVNPYHFGRVEFAETPLAPRPRVALPASLAVGMNELSVTGAREGWSLLTQGKPLTMDGEGRAFVVVDKAGPFVLELADPSGTVVETCEAAVPRPLLVEVIEPFGDIPDGVAVRLRNNCAAQVEVSVEAVQGGKTLSATALSLPPGEREIQLPVDGASAGDIDITAKGTLSAGTRSLELQAVHWCSRGVKHEDVDRFRDGIGALETRSLYRAALADACNYYRYLQAGDGRYRAPGMGGRLVSSEWYYGMVYAFALIYKSDWPENPYHGDRRFLTSAIAGLDAGLDAAASYPQGAEARNVGAYIAAYELVKDEVPAALREYWAQRLTGIVEHIVETRIEPAMYLYQIYSNDVGTGTNHIAYYSMDVFAAGKALGREDWTELGRRALQALARHGEDGHFPERRGVPVTHYTWLSMNALGAYYWQTGDETVLEALRKCPDFACHTSLPSTEIMLVHDGRNNHYGLYEYGDFVLSLTSEGRHLARRRLEAVTSKPGPSAAACEYWYRAAENALYFLPGEERALPEEAEFVFSGARGLVVRSKGFICGLSAICVPATDDTYIVDAQNTIELHHAEAGHILHGANSQSQPEAGSFMRRLPGRTEFLPVDGSIEKTYEGHMATLVFDTFSVRLRFRVVSESEAEIAVELLSATGPEPVVYNFFPAVMAPEEPAVLENRTSLRYGGIELEFSRPVDFERDFKIIDPYSQRYTVGTAPVRASVVLEKYRPFVINVRLAD